MENKDKVFIKPSKSTFFNPYSISFGVGKYAVGHIMLDEDSLDAFVSERLIEKITEMENKNNCSVMDSELLTLIKSYL